MECPQCGESWNGEDRCPRILYCGHVFCEACLRAWLKDKDSISCGVCGKEQHVHQGDVSYLIHVKHLAEMKKPQTEETLLASADEAALPATDVIKDATSVAAIELGNSFAPPKRNEDTHLNLDTPDSKQAVSVHTSAGEDAAGSIDVSFNSSSSAVPNPIKDVSLPSQDEVKEPDVAVAVECSHPFTVVSETLAMKNDPNTDSAPRTRSLDACGDEIANAQVNEDKPTAAASQDVCVSDNPWAELIEHSTAIVEHTVGAVICVGQGVAEADRQFGISTAVVGAVVGITRRVSETILADPPLLGDNSRGTQEASAGSAVCVIS